MKNRTLLVSAFLAGLALSSAARAEELPYVQESKHYIVKTNIDKKTCVMVAAIMDKLYEQLMAMLPVEEKERPKLEIMLWGKPSQFVEYCNRNGISMPPNFVPIGFFVPSKNQILAGKAGDLSEVLRVLYHEATHQFVDMMMGNHNPPVWVNEGMAVYFENSQWKAGNLRTGFKSDWLGMLKKALQKGDYMPLEELIQQTDYSKWDTLQYGESWSLVYFFVHANKGIYGKRLGKYLLLIKDGKDPGEAFKECFPADMKKLEAAWKQFVLKKL